MKAQYRSGLLVLITFSRIRCSLTFLHGYVASSTSINRSPLSLSPSLDPGLASRNAITSTRIGSGGNSAIEEWSQNNNAHSSPTIAIVGAGVGGLSIASRVAASPDLPPSTKIVILEKNSHEKVGGRCGSFFRDVPGFGKFRFERGPSLLLLRDVYLDLFRDCGKDAKDFGLDIKQCNPAYQVVFDDGDAIQLGFPKKANLINDNVKKLEEISRRKMDEYENNGSTKWDEYMRATEAFLDCGLPNFIEERFDLKSFPSFIIEATRDGLKSWPLKAHSEVLDKTFASNKMKALASFQDLYVGLEPYKNNNQIGGGVLKKSAPAVFGLLAALELHPTNDKAGVFAPLGGFQKVSQAFEKLALDSGVEIHYNKNVESITSDGIFYSHLDGDSSDRGTPEFLPADMIIVNADLPYSTKTLLNNSKKEQQVSPPQPSIPRYDWDDKFDFSSGVIAFYFSVKKKCDSLNTHNVFLVSSSRSKMEKSWSAVRDNDPTVSSFDDVNFPFNFYVHRASGTDGSAAPSNCDSLMVLVPCCTLKRDEYLAGLPRDESIAGYKEQFDNEFISKVKDIVLQRLGVLDGLEDLQSNIVDEVVETPATYADSYNVGAGTPFALSHGFEQLSLTRPGQQSKEDDNILFVGASTRPGNGVPLVLLGSKQVAKKAISKIKSYVPESV